MKHTNKKIFNLLKQSQVLIAIFLFNSIMHAFEFDSELWPGEGRPTFRAKHDSLIFHEKPSKSSSTIKFHRLKKDDSIIYDRTIFRTIKPSIIIALISGKFYGRSFGNITYLSRKLYYSKSNWLNFNYERGDSLQYLQYRAEGNCIVRYQGEIIEVEHCLWDITENEKQFKKISNNVTEWWVRVTDSDHKPVGWILIDKKSVEFLDRRF